jgi:YVTN family beta-propeller protein
VSRGATVAAQAVMTCAAALALGCAGPPLPATQSLEGPRVSTPIALSSSGDRLWVVNPDADTVTLIDTATSTVLDSFATGREPWSVAPISDGAVVANRASGTLTVVRHARTHEIPVGPEPGGVVVAPDDRRAYVTLSSDDIVAAVDLDERRVRERIPVGRLPWAIGLVPRGSGSAPTLVVAHRLAQTDPQRLSHGRRAWLTLVDGDHVTAELLLATQADGVVNGLEALAIAEGRVWVTHQLSRPDPPFTFHTTLSGGIATVSIVDRQDLVDRHIETNDPSFSTPVNFPRAIAVSRDGTRAFVALAGSDAVMGIDLTTPDAPRLLGFWAVGANPRGIVLSPDETRAYVMNYLSRDVSVLDLGDTIRYPEIARVPTAEETLEPDLALGKRLFHNATDPRLSRLGWVSCASCHLDGGVDGTTWMTPEGPRLTKPLWSLEGTAPFHASATRDEIQDFDHDIRALMGGVGLAPGPLPSMLGPPAAGRSDALDALAAFVLRGIRVPAAPSGDPAAAARGQKLFDELGCQACHGGSAWTRSSLPGPAGSLAPNGELEVEAVLVDVGTFEAGSPGLGSNGFDVPTLLGLHATSPYLHDGSAPTLADVLANETHVGRRLTPIEVDDLVAFLLVIDATMAPFD